MTADERSGTRQPQSGGPDALLQEPLDAAVETFEETFRGVAVEGLDLATTVRLGFYIVMQLQMEFASPSKAKRAWRALLAHAIFLRARWAGTSPPPPPRARPGEPRLLFLFEGPNPSSHETLRTVLAQFGPSEARAATAYPQTLAGKTGHEWIDLREFLPARTGDALKGVAGAVRRAQRRAATPLLRRASLRAWLLHSAIRTAATARALRAVFDAFPATALVTAADTSLWGYCATMEAARRDIPSVVFQHGMMVGRSAYTPVFSTRFAAWGDASARWLRARGVPAGKIVVTGAPRLDGVLNRTPAPRETLAKVLGVDPAVRWIVLATNPISFPANAAMVAVAREGLRTWGERAVLLLKLHPSEDPGPYRARIGVDPDTVIVPHGTVDLYDLLAAADAVLTFHSSVGLEAMLLDRPVVSLEAFGEENPLAYAREGTAAVARTAAELAEALRREAGEGTARNERRERRARFIRDNLLAADGKSGERARDLIRALAAGEVS